MQISATFRYATESHWVIAKGALFKGQAGRGKGGSAIIPPLRELSVSADYLDVSHCACEQWISQLLDDAASSAPGEKIKTGNPRAWREYGTIHHLTQTVESIANLV
jgi:hypothetical protein